MGCDRLADEAGEENGDEEDATRNRDSVALEAGPDELPVAARGRGRVRFLVVTPTLRVTQTRPETKPVVLLGRREVFLQVAVGDGKPSC